MASTQDSNIHAGSAADKLPSATTQALEASSAIHHVRADGTQESAAPLNTRPDDSFPENLMLQYDYPGKVRSLCSDIDPKLFNKFFLEHFRPKVCKAYILNTFDIGFEGMWKAVRDPTEHTWELRAAFERATHTQQPYILIVEDINEHAAQDLGSLLDLDPCFLAQHLGTAETMARPPVELRNLRRNFFSPATIKDRRSAHVIGFIKYLAVNQQTIHRIRGMRSTVDAADAADDVSKIVSDRPVAGSDRIENHSTSVPLNPRISCCQVGTQGCMSSAFEILMSCQCCH